MREQRARILILSDDLDLRKMLSAHIYRVVVQIAIFCGSDNEWTGQRRRSFANAPHLNFAKSLFFSSFFIELEV